MNNSIKSSLIISTYNWKDALRLVLESLFQQTQLPDEIIIADDGSTKETKDLIDYYISKSPINIKHIWHEDKGFRRSVILNKAIKEAQYEYIIQIDGDVLLHKNFIKQHLLYAEKKTFLSGSRTMLTKIFSQQIIQSKKLPNIKFWTSGIKNRINSFQFSLFKLPFKKENTDIKKLVFKVRGCNMSFWKNDLLEINGYDENFVGWGREDSELAYRLLLKSVSLKKIKFVAIQFHLYHPENNKANLKQNDELLNKLMQTNKYKCLNGIVKL